MTNSVNDSGFSLVELMVVIAVIAIISLIAIPMYSNYQVRAKLSRTDITARSYINEITHYIYENGEFPDEGSELCGCVEINKDSVIQVCKERADAQNATVKVYVGTNLVPDVVDPYYRYNLTQTD